MQERKTATTVLRSTSSVVTRNGLPLLPKSPAATPVTSELVRQLQEELP
jgi:hypothetical protein